MAHRSYAHRLRGRPVHQAPCLAGTPPDASVLLPLSSKSFQNARLSSRHGPELPRIWAHRSCTCWLEARPNHINMPRTVEAHALRARPCQPPGSNSHREQATCTQGILTECKTCCRYWWCQVMQFLYRAFMPQLTLWKHSLGPGSPGRDLTPAIHPFPGRLA